MAATTDPQEINEFEKSIGGFTDTLVNLMSELHDSFNEDTFEELVETQKELANMLKEAGPALHSPGGKSSSALAVGSIAEIQIDILKAQKEIADKIDLSGIDKFFGLIEKIPGGKFLHNLLGLDTISNDIKKNIRDEFINSMKTVNGKVQTDLVGGFSKGISIIGSGIKGVFSSLMLNPWLIAIGVLGAAFVYLEKKQSAANDFMKTTGLTLGNISRTRGDVEDLTIKYAKMGVSGDEIYASAEGLYNAFGNINSASKDMLESMLTMNVQWGITTSAASSFASSIKSFGNIDDKKIGALGRSMAKGVELMGMSPDAVFKDMEQHSEAIEKYFYKFGTSATKAMLDIYKMGVGMGQMEKSISHVLDFEQSISDEMEASAILNRNIDLGAARRAAFEGDTVTAMKEITNQLGNQSDFNKLNIYQREALAKATGMSVKDINEMYKKQDAMNKMDSVKRAQLEAINKQLENANNLTGEEELTNKRNELSLASLKHTMEGLLTVIAQLIAPIAAGLEWVMNAFDSITGSVGGATSMLGGFVRSLSILGVIAAATFATVWLYRKAGGVFGMLFPKGSIEAPLVETERAVSATLPGIGRAIAGFLSALANPEIWLGIAALGAIMGILVLSVIGLAYALNLAAPGFIAIGTAIQLSLIGLGAFFAEITIERAAALWVMVPALYALAGALAAVGVASLLIPKDLISKISVNHEVSNKQTETKTEDSLDTKIGKILDEKFDKFLNALNSMAVNMDGQKVGRVIAAGIKK
jgi:DNA-binding transcriptional MerR regulator